MSNIIKKDHPLYALRGVASDITAKFSLNDAITVDPVTGIMHMPEGYARLFYHQKTGTVHLIASTNIQDLGVESGFPTDEGLRNSSHVASFRGKFVTPDNFSDMINRDAIAYRLYDKVEQFRTEIRGRAARHMALYTAKIPDSEVLRNRGIYSDAELSTNGRIAYATGRDKRGKYRVVSILPIRRHEGSFAPFSLTDSGLQNYFNKVAHTIGKFDTYEDAVKARSDHWAKMGETLKAEKSIFSGQGRGVRASVAFKKAANAVNEHMMRLCVALAAGSLVGHYLIGSPWSGAVIATIEHMITHMTADSVYEKSVERVKEAKQKGDQIEKYTYGEDTTNFFRIWSKEWMGRIQSPVDVKRFTANEFEAIPFDKLNIKNRAGRLSDRPYMADVKEHVVFMHMRDVPSDCFVLDANTVVHMHTNGITNVLHKDDSKKVHVFTVYNPDGAINGVPDFVADELSKGVVSFAYNLKTGGYTETRYFDTEDTASLVESISAKMMETSGKCYDAPADAPWYEALHTALAAKIDRTAPKAPQIEYLSKYDYTV